jgi:hypothetical protein
MTQAGGTWLQQSCPLILAQVITCYYQLIVTIFLIGQTMQIYELSFYLNYISDYGDSHKRVCLYKYNK